jgi:hypothetical protein
VRESAIDLYSLEATLNLFETLSGDWGGGNRPFFLFQTFFSPLHCEFWMGRWAFFGLTETAKKANTYHLSSHLSSIHPSLRGKFTKNSIIRRTKMKRSQRVIRAALRQLESLSSGEMKELEKKSAQRVRDMTAHTSSEDERL